MVASERFFYYYGYMFTIILNESESKRNSERTFFRSRVIIKDNI